ncbi:MAG: hypothetical protein IPL95_10535 [Saprospiraceae bacterium]|nr:hypothetical protein [Saprospiraceae bacterium]
MGSSWGSGFTGDPAGWYIDLIGQADVFFLKYQYRVLILQRLEKLDMIFKQFLGKPIPIKHGFI